jgi:protein-tyrosine phosphatase
MAQASNKQQATSQSFSYLVAICTGNTCRTPMAAKLLQHALAAEKAPLNQIAVESAGVATACGEQAQPASENSIVVALA